MEKEFKDLLEDSLCVGQRIAASTSSNLNSNFAANKSKHEGDERVLLFLKFKSEHRGKGTLDENLRKRIQETIKDRLSPRHVPEVVEEVEDIPVSFSYPHCPFRTEIGGCSSFVYPFSLCTFTRMVRHTHTKINCVYKVYCQRQED